jgi:hypothetical protein
VPREGELGPRDSLGLVAIRQGPKILRPCSCPGPGTDRHANGENGGEWVRAPGGEDGFARLVLAQDFRVGCAACGLTDVQ